MAIHGVRKKNIDEKIFIWSVFFFVAFLVGIYVLVQLQYQNLVAFLSHSILDVDGFGILAVPISGPLNKNIYETISIASSFFGSTWAIYLTFKSIRNKKAFSESDIDYGVGRLKKASVFRLLIFRVAIFSLSVFFFSIFSNGFLGFFPSWHSTFFTAIIFAFLQGASSLPGVMLMFLLIKLISSDIKKIAKILN